MFYTYVLRCADLKLYIGSTSDLQNRVNEHIKGLVKSTRNRRPIELVYYEACKYKNLAIKRENYFKTGYGRAFLKKRINKPS